MSSTVPTDRIVQQSEDLIPHAMKLNKDTLKSEKAKGPPKVTSPGVLMTVGQQAMQKLVDGAFEKLEISSADELPPYRVKLSDKIRWSIPNLLNAVTEPGFYNMVTRQAWGIREDIIRSQPNGDWQPTAFRFVEILDEMNNIPHLHLVIRWMDLNNEDEIRYANGAPVSSPTVNVHNDNLGYKELIAAMNNKDSANDQLVELLTKLLANQAGVEKEPAVAAPPSKEEPKVEKKTSGKKAKKNLPPGV
tara:strand:+ start:2079 stop:2819 length:741 start_codon:yes stop_codon:yes gene_type:complete